ncbi:MAG: T9SS type A sorting domain-containing protein, partial [Clostridiales bacterium]|nr:T9SS type A sorting domain-containing protein [Clostridiales bacterium]
PEGEYSLTAVATDNLGKSATSASVDVLVRNKMDVFIRNNIPPIVTIDSPSNGTEFIAPATINIAANASDADGSISKVEFFNGILKLGEMTSTPWSFAWDNVPEGEYSLTAVATDNLGQSSTSRSVSIIIRSENVEINSIFTLYPNPNNGIFTIDFSQSLNTIYDRHLTIASVDGKVIYNEIILKDELIKKINLTYIDSGIYIVKITASNMFQTCRFIK